MTSYDNYSSYTPVEISTPPRSRLGTPISTPSRAALLKQNFMNRGSPTKFSLNRSEKASLREVEFDADCDEPEGKRFPVARLILCVLGLAMWLLLIASDVYMYLLLNSILMQVGIVYSNCSFGSNAMVQLAQGTLPFWFSCCYSQHRLFYRLFDPLFPQISLLSVADRPRPYTPSHRQLDYVHRLHSRNTHHFDRRAICARPFRTI